METLLWLMLLGRFIRWVFPYVAGIVGAIILMGMMRPPCPPEYELPLFIVCAAGIAVGIKTSLPSRRQDPPAPTGWYRHPDDRRRR